MHEFIRDCVGVRTWAACAPGDDLAASCATVALLETSGLAVLPIQVARGSPVSIVVRSAACPAQEDYDIGCSPCSRP